MEANRRIPITGDWYLGTDGMSLLLLKRQVVSAEKARKKENVGKENYITFGYYSSLKSLAAGLHRYLSIDVLMNDGPKTLEDFVEKLDERIQRITKLDEAMVRSLTQRIGASNE
jgi:hypothetical protein